MWKNLVLSKALITRANGSVYCVGCGRILWIKTKKYSYGFLIHIII